jgi:two-component system chemotaxis response regulator CheB
MAHHDIIVIGASSGGVEVLAQLAQGLPKGLPAAIFVVCHFPPGSRSVLPDIISRSGPLLAVHPHDGDPVYPGHIYVAPPDHHLLVDNGTVRLSRGPRENGHRPAIDPLFRSAARVYGSRVIGMVLSGALYDGVAGLLAIRAAGGIAIVQDPQDALVAALPTHATEVAGADHIVPSAALAPLLARLVQEPTPEKGDRPMTDPIDQVQKTQVQDQEAQKNGQRRGALSVFTCPECGGALWQADEEQVVRFRCHVGHAYYAETLLAEQTEILEAALWTAVRTFKDKTVLARQLALRERERGNDAAAQRFDEQAGQAEQYGKSIQEYLQGGAQPASAS